MKKTPHKRSTQHGLGRFWRQNMPTNFKGRSKDCHYHVLFLLAGNFWQILVFCRIVKLCLRIKRVHQPADALKLGTVINSLAFKRIAERVAILSQICNPFFQFIFFSDENNLLTPTSFFCYVAFPSIWVCFFSSLGPVFLKFQIQQQSCGCCYNSLHVGWLSIWMMRRIQFVYVCQEAI